MGYKNLYLTISEITPSRFNDLRRLSFRLCIVFIKLKRGKMKEGI